ncbi:MAG: D-tyrosyl-tRNA(Tyr) deacylase, partial [Planctomycetota bacterium]
MRAVVQRVSRARVLVGEEVVGEIGRGLVILLGVARSDTAEQATWLADKVVSLRIFQDAQENMNLGLGDVGGAV